MTPPDDLHVGMWIAIVSDKSVTADEPRGIFGMVQPRPDVCTGEPLQILAYSFPFLCVSNGERSFPIDIRKYDVQRLNKAYVNALRNHQPAPLQAKRITKQDREGCCPNCGSRMVQRRSLQVGWRMHCRECGKEELIHG